MGLDVRLPMGLLFLTIGVVLTGFGVWGDKAIYARSLGINVNLWWGLVMMAVGLVLLALSRRHSSAMRSLERERDASPKGPANP